VGWARYGKDIHYIHITKSEVLMAKIVDITTKNGYANPPGRGLKLED